MIPRSGRSPGEGNGNALQYSCLEKSMDRAAWWATVQGIAKSQTQLSTQIAEHAFFKKNVCLFHKISFLGNFLAVQWLGLSTSAARALGSIPSQGTKIPEALRHSKTNNQSNTHIHIYPFFSEKYSDIYTFSVGKSDSLTERIFFCYSQCIILSFKNVLI